MSPALAGKFFTTEALGKPSLVVVVVVVVVVWGVCMYWFYMFRNKDMKSHCASYPLYCWLLEAQSHVGERC